MNGIFIDTGSEPLDLLPGSGVWRVNRGCLCLFVQFFTQVEVSGHCLAGLHGLHVHADVDGPSSFESLHCAADMSAIGGGKWQRCLFLSHDSAALTFSYSSSNYRHLKRTECLVLLFVGYEVPARPGT